MKIREVMTPRVIRISPEESASVAARTMTHYNVGAMPVCGLDGKLCGMVSLGDLALSRETEGEAADALTQISSNLTRRD